MKYKNAREVMPEWLLEKLQDYIQGEVVYIPKKNEIRAGWGEINGIRRKYFERNVEIVEAFSNGSTINELSVEHCLSEHSIKKILSGMKKSAYC